MIEFKERDSAAKEGMPNLLKAFKKLDVLLSGKFIVECRDKHGHVKWKEETNNLIVNEGLNAILDIMLHGVTQITTWYIAIFDSNTTPLSSHTYGAPGWVESTEYDEGERQEYVEAASATESITNAASKAVFTMNGTVTIYGAALVGGSTVAATPKDTSTGPATGHKLFCSSLFSAGKSVEDDDVLNVTYIVGAASTS